MPACSVLSWGGAYQPSEVERILLGEEPQPSADIDDDDTDVVRQRQRGPDRLHFPT